MRRPASVRPTPKRWSAFATRLPISPILPGVESKPRPSAFRQSGFRKWLGSNVLRVAPIQCIYNTIVQPQNLNSTLCLMRPAQRHLSDLPRNFLLAWLAPIGDFIGVRH
jgi:hypothetical protein